jgi:hypothetical protein
MKKYYLKFKHWMEWNPPGALSFENWELFNKEYKKSAPIRYWIDKSLMSFYYSQIRKINSVLNYIILRTTQRWHIITTELKPGWHDTSTILLYGAFKVLIDHVECTIASKTYTYIDDYSVKKWYECNLYYRIFNIRNSYLGLKKLEEESQLDDPSLPAIEQHPTLAHTARTILKLYKWWKFERPSRKLLDCPIYYNQGYIMGPLDSGFDRSAVDYIEYNKITVLNNELSINWELEDQSMLFELISIRNNLWN